MDYASATAFVDGNGNFIVHLKKEFNTSQNRTVTIDVGSNTSTTSAGLSDVSTAVPVELTELANVMTNCLEGPSSEAEKAVLSFIMTQTSQLSRTSKSN